MISLDNNDLIGNTNVNNYMLFNIDILDLYDNYNHLTQEVYL